MNKDQWDKTFERMLIEADQKKECSEEWDVALQRLADKWNETAEKIQCC